MLQVPFRLRALIPPIEEGIGAGQELGPDQEIAMGKAVTVSWTS
jgi:hypothetical protein